MPNIYSMTNHITNSSFSSKKSCSYSLIVHWVRKMSWEKYIQNRNPKNSFCSLNSTFNHTFNNDKNNLSTNMERNLATYQTDITLGYLNSGYLFFHRFLKAECYEIFGVIRLIVIRQLRRYQMDIHSAFVHYLEWHLMLIYLIPK